MEAIIFIIIGAGLAYFLMNFSSQESEKTLANEVLLAKDDIDTFIHYKKRIRQTSYYENREVYNQLHSNIYELTCVFVEGYRRYLITENAWSEIASNYEKYLEVEKEFVKEYQGWRILRTLRIEEVDSDVLLALAMLCFLHKDIIGSMKILRNSFFTNRVVEYLIEERLYKPASLAKGLILKYGVQPCVMPDTKYSTAIFESLLSEYPFLHNEVNDSYRFAGLSDIPPADKIQSTFEKWFDYEGINERVKVYHPLNVNGNSGS